jgi:hypothetical protein
VGVLVGVNVKVALAPGRGVKVRVGQGVKVGNVVHVAVASGSAVHVGGGDGVGAGGARIKSITPMQ